MTQQTPLFEQHQAAGAKMVPFAGWDMPVHYGSQLDEHHCVRQRVGMFDVSHMTVTDITGRGAREFLRNVLANDVDRMTHAGKAQYGTLLNDQGGIIDDLIAYRRADHYRLVTNAGTRTEVMDWLSGCVERLGSIDTVVSERPELALIAVQGPQALAVLKSVLDIDLSSQTNPFEFLESDDLMLARTGYTGEDGAELILPGSRAASLWAELQQAGVSPIGLGARDTLRLEAGLNLYGQDMTSETSPLVSNLAWTVAMRDDSRQFIGRDALQRQKRAGLQSKLTGVVMQARGVMRHDYKLETNAGEGVITSGIFSPTLGYSIGLARVPKDAHGDAEVIIRNKRAPVQLTRPPFVRNGESAWT